ncbi:TPA: phage tail protein [Proteus mirabilis]|nr:phage tail protein [Proteus mirabilis]
MSAKFFALLTVIGANKLAKATALGTTLKITQMAVGDGGGTLPTPDTQQTKLVGEKRRAGLNTLFVDPKNDSQIIAEQVIPENEGGYWIREIGLFDDEGSLIAVGNCPETYKPQLQEGSGRTQTIRMILTVSHTESVELKVDPSVILATRESVDNAIEIASKSILDTVEKEYSTKDEVKKKFDNSNIVHEKGVSKEKVISQKGVTELFQPKGNYQPAGNYVTTTTFNLEINKKIDKASLSQQLGNDVNKVPSLDLVTREIGKKQPVGNYALKGDSYTKAEENNLLNNKLDKSGGEVGAITVTTDSHGRNLQLKRSDSKPDSPQPELISFHHGNDSRRGYIGYGGFNNTLTISNEEENASINIESSKLTFNGDNILTKTEAGKIFQPKGNYPTVSEMNTALDKKQPVGNYALKGDSYTKAEENNLLNNKLDKSGGEVGAIIVTTDSHGRNLQLKRSNSKPDSPQPELISFHHGNDSRRGYIGYGGFNNTLTISNEEENASINIESSKLNFNGDRVLTESDIIVPHPIPWSLPTAPAGYLICQGQTFNKSTYPKLAIAYPSGRLPELRSEFIRGADAGRGIDTGREVLSSQSGNSLLSAMWRGTVTEQKDWENKTSYVVEIGTNNSGYFTIGQQIEGKFGNETRPRNIAFLYIVRAA